MNVKMHLTVICMSAMYLLCNGYPLAAESGSKRFLNTLTHEERDWLAAHPVITVATDPGWPPVEFTDSSGKPSGMSIDYLNLIEQRLGVRFRNAGINDWQRAYALLKEWKIDMTTSVAETEERRGFWAFTRPYMSIPIVIATQIDVPYIADISELNGTKVAVVDSYVADYWLERDYPKIVRVKVKSSLEGLIRLQRGEVHAFIENLLIIGDYQAKLKVSAIKIAGQTPYTNAQCMAVRKDWKIFAGILQKALDDISESEKNAIYRKWLPVRYEYGFNYTILLIVALALGAALLVFFLWNWKLSTEIKQRKLAESRAKALLDEKDLLLREVHHRIKNNMNTIKGLLSLQIESEENPSAAESLREAESRVQSMIMLYERLYRSGDYREMPVRDYVESLVMNIQGGFGNRRSVRLELDIEDFIIGIQILSPVGIIINELVTNAMKHAFPDGSEGVIHVGMRTSEGRVLLEVRDNGVGIKEETNPKERKGFGLELVRLLAEQINGELHIEHDAGTAVSVTFDL